jgi:hypothetical protein
VVVVGNLLIPAVSKLNTGQSWKRHPRIPLPSTYQSQGNLSLSFFIVAAFTTNPPLLRRKKPVVKEPQSKRAKPSPAAIPQTPDAPIPSPARNDIDMEDADGQFDSIPEANPTTEATANDVVQSEKASDLFQGQMADASAGSSLFWRQKQLEIVNLITSQEDASNQLSSGIAAFVEKTATMKKVYTPSSPRAPWQIFIDDPLWSSKRNYFKLLRSIAPERCHIIQCSVENFKFCTE